MEPMGPMEPIGPVVVILPLLFCVVIGAISLAGLAFWIWMIVDCATNEPSEGNEKIVWILVIVLASVIGALVYYFARRPTRKATVGR